MSCSSASLVVVKTRSAKEASPPKRAVFQEQDEVKKKVVSVFHCLVFSSLDETRQVMDEEEQG